MLISASGHTARRAAKILQRNETEVGVILPGGGLIPSWGTVADFVMSIPLKNTDSIQRMMHFVESALESNVDAFLPLGSDPESNQALSSLLRATSIDFIGPSTDKYRSILNRVGVRWAAMDLGMEVITTSEMIEDLADATYWLTRIPCPVVVRTLRQKSRRFFSKSDALKYIETVISAGPIVIEQLVLDAIEVETVMFAQHDLMPICLGEIDMTKRGTPRRNLTEFPPATLSENWLMRIRRNAALLIMGLQWRGLIAARFLITKDQRAYFLQLNPGFQPWHVVVENAIGADMIDAQIRVNYGEPLGWNQSDIRFKGNRIGLQIIALTEGLVESIEIDLEDKSTAYWSVSKGDFVRHGMHIVCIVCSGSSRQEAIVRCRNALESLNILGIETNIADLQNEFLSTEYWHSPTTRQLATEQYNLDS